MLDNANCLSKVDVAPKKKLATGFKALHPMMDLMAERHVHALRPQTRGKLVVSLVISVSFKLCVTSGWRYSRI